MTALHIERHGPMPVIATSSSPSGCCKHRHRSCRNQASGEADCSLLLRDYQWIESNTWWPRLTAAMILSGSAVQAKRRGSSLVSSRKRLIAAFRSTIERKTPRLRRRLASLAKKPSTALSQDAEVGV